jgi:hypothetical protein
MPARAGLLGIIALAVAVVLTPAVASAVIIPGVDYATIGPIGNVYQGDVMISAFMTSDLTAQGGPPSIANGQLTSTVYYDGTKFTYVLQVTPLQAGESRVSTGFLPALYNNSAGWDFAGAALAGAPGTGSTAFTENLSSTNLGWTKVATGSTLWSITPDLVTFFIQSTVAPGLSTYNLAGTGLPNGSAPGWAPVAAAEPSSLLLLAFGVVGTVAVASTRRGFRANRAA